MSYEHSMYISHIHVWVWYIFMKLLYIAIKRVQFSINNIMYQQTDGSSMGTPLLRTFLLGSRKEKRFKITNLSLFCKRYVHYIFVIFSSRLESRRFFNSVDELHPALTFTCKFERSNGSPFLDVLVERANFSLQMSIYRKPEFTGSYTQCVSFCPPRRKINLINCLNDLLQTKLIALMICFN